MPSETPSDMVGLWREGYANGNKEGLSWAIDAIAELSTKAKTSHGKSALRYAAQVIMEERDRKFPPPTPSGDGSQ